MFQKFKNTVIGTKIHYIIKKFRESEEFSGEEKK